MAAVPQIDIVSWDLASQLLGMPSSHYLHVISINDPHVEPPESFHRHSARKLALAFEDIRGPLEEKEAWEKAPTLEDVRTVLEFASSIKSRDPVLVHCWAGISRSSSVALAILASRCAPSSQGAEAAFRHLFEAKGKDGISPNAHITRYADELLGFQGALLYALRRHFYRWKSDEDWDRLNAIGG